MRTRVCCLALATTFLAVSQGKADFTICNKSPQPVMILAVLPTDGCRSKQRERTNLVFPEVCSEFYSGDAKGKTFYYTAWTWDDDEWPKWLGETEMYLDGRTTDLCVPHIGCRLSQGATDECAGVISYRMREVKVTSTHKVVNLVL